MQMHAHVTEIMRHLVVIQNDKPNERHEIAKVVSYWKQTRRNTPFFQILIVEGI